MKVRTSISLSKELLDDLDRIKDRFGSRSEMIEVALRALLDSVERQERDARDLAILNRQAERLKSEASEVLSYQSQSGAAID